MFYLRTYLLQHIVHNLFFHFSVVSNSQGVVESLPVGRLASYGDSSAGIEYAGGGVIQSPVQLAANRGTIPTGQPTSGGSWGPNLATVSGRIVMCSSVGVILTCCFFSL